MPAATKRNQALLAEAFSAPLGGFKERIMSANSQSASHPAGMPIT